MPKKPSDKHKLRPDVAETAFRVMLEATRQQSKTDPEAGTKNPNAVRQGKQGGTARAASATPTERSEAAKLAASVRWTKKP